MRFATLTLAVVLLVPGMLAQGHAQTAPGAPTPDQLIASRQAGYDLQAGVAVAMQMVIAAKLDVRNLEDGAKGLASWGRAIPDLFPDGTQIGHDTKALPSIWTDRAGFEKAADNFVTQAEKLGVLAAANDKEGFAAQYTVTTKACGTCHRGYRAKG